MNVGPWQLLIVAIVILVLFGRGRISEMMGDFGKGIKSFKQGMNEESRSPERIDHQAPAPTTTEKTAAPTAAPAATSDSEKSS
ncbi:MAG: twin-arginine translocase TatA/TatE family subunit [Croceicoccus sp.]|nr:twin-arginine translocase TatA/TatE family subunit [Croceicoccus sp.]MAL25841.1 twin-arginine translocase TatA/TatE family subunit [Croceicoccus sp.]|tara:strand:+ start:24351 stop:24599 length:249 start_codon:yes stop_codon:yes gene_type:complete